MIEVPKWLLHIMAFFAGAGFTSFIALFWFVMVGRKKHKERFEGLLKDLRKRKSLEKL